jgi:hypothetical protein
MADIIISGSVNRKYHQERDLHNPSPTLDILLKINGKAANLQIGHIGFCAEYC